MRYKLILIIFLILSTSLSLKVSAQISPGALSKAHSQLEGISNCTSCHDLGDKVSNNKCLDCHKPLKVRVVGGKGYHASREVKGKDCISCHSEHHGIKFDLIRFDQNKFDHNLTGYELKGSHKNVDCRQCHAPENISDLTIKKDNNTYLGLDVRCLTCHDDYHKKTLSNDCVQCHGFDKFSPAVNFNHSKTSFALKGAHQKVACIECHKVELTEGKKFQHFSNIPHNQCSSCHKDPHKGQFGTQCSNCHTESSFTTMKATSEFNHSLTGFKLEGIHKTIDCRKCHDNRNGNKESYKEFVEIDPINCLTCHDDMHESKFGSDCRNCHDQQNFKNHINKESFDHSKTDYALAGKHITVDCKKCHTSGSKTDPMPFNSCNACHDDFHKGVFAQTRYNDCASCHDVNGFEQSLYTIDMHRDTPFPLKGAHLATPCIACHLKNEEWAFRSLGTQCIDCHTNIHQEYISAKYYPNNDCTACHNNEAWGSIAFDHSKTQFELLGKHAEITCSQCHIEKDNARIIIRQNFINLDTKCASCHENIHGSQFDVEGITDCARCHGFSKWDRSQFNHDNTAFKLEGAHAKVSCERCHETVLEDGKSVVKYKNGKLECRDCHL